MRLHRLSWVVRVLVGACRVPARPYTCSTTVHRVELALQGTLLGAQEPTVDWSFAGAKRVELVDAAWVEHVPVWLRGADELFTIVAGSVQWQRPLVRMWDRQLPQPRLSGLMRPGERPAMVEEMRAALSGRYAQEFLAVGANLSRRARQRRVARRQRRPHDAISHHRDRVARRSSALSPATNRRRPIGPLRAGLRRSLRDGRLVPTHLAALRAEGGPRGTADLAHVPPQVRLMTSCEKCPRAALETPGRQAAPAENDTVPLGRLAYRLGS